MSTTLHRTRSATRTADPDDTARPSGTGTAERRPRELWIDAVRAGALLVVVLGHWLMAAVTLRGTGPAVTLETASILELEPATHLLTWPLQVMGVFFAAGSVVVARSHMAAPAAERTAHGVGRETWSAFVAGRTHRLVLPALPLLAVWWAATPALTAAFGEGVVVAAGRAALVPLWFMATYVVVQAMTPGLLRLTARHGVARLVGACLVLSALGDGAHHGLGLPGVGVLSYLWVWAIPTVLGIAVAEGRLSGRALGLTAFGALVTAAMLVLHAGYSVPVVGVGTAGGRPNTAPPSLVLALHALGYTTAVLGLAPRAERWLGATARRRTVLRRAAELSMPVYLWHMTAMVLVAATAVVAATAGSSLPVLGDVLALTPLSGGWWITRPVWVAICAGAVVALLVLVLTPTRLLVQALGRRTGAELPAVVAGLAAVTVVAGLALVVSSPQPVPVTGGAMVLAGVSAGTVWRTWVRMISPISRGRSSGS